MGWEHKVYGAAERPSASAFLARYKRFRYIETRSAMKISDNRATAGGRAIVGRNPSAPQLGSTNSANQSLSPYEIRRRERAISIIKSPNSVSRMCSNSLKTNERDMLKSPKNQEMRFLHPPSPWRMDDGLRQGTAIYPELRMATVPKSAQDSGLPTLVAEATPEVRVSNRPSIYKAGSSRCSTLLPGSAPHSKTAVTYRKQMPAHFLPGSRIALLETRICAKMSAQISSKLSTQMKRIQ